MVDAIALAYLEVTPPFLHGHGYMTRQGEHAGIMFSSEEGGVTVNGELSALCGEAPYAEGLLHLVVSIECDVDAIEGRMMLAPQLQTVIAVDNPGVGEWILRLGNHLLANDITIVASPRDEDELHLRISLELTVDIYRYLHLFPFTIGSDDQVVDVRRRPLFQIYPADDSVPVGLGILGVGMRITDDLRRNSFLTVVHHHGDVMDSRLELLR